MIYIYIPLYNWDLERTCQLAVPPCGFDQDLLSMIPSPKNFDGRQCIQLRETLLRHQTCWKIPGSQGG